jgi:dihydrodipicolinate synthase/N-acetylneuraminate lyase
MDKAQLGGYLVSVPLPWDDNGQLLVDQFRAATRKLLKEGCDGIYLFGTSGEGYAVSDSEFKVIIDLFEVETQGFDGFVQVGCFGLISEQVKVRCDMASDRGIAAVQITLPFWKELNDGELTRYFQDVCGSFPDMSFLLYNNPRNKRRLSGAELARIIPEVPNLHGTKTGSGSWMDFYELLTATPTLRHFVTEGAFPFCHPLGAAGLIPSSNYARPRLSHTYHEAVLAGDLERSQELHQNIIRFFYETALPLGRKGYIDGAIDKAYARIGGMDMPLYMKSPYMALTEADFGWLEDLVKRDFPDA